MDYLESFGVEKEKSTDSEQIVYRLVIAYTLVFDGISKFLKEHDLTPAKLNALMIIKHQGKGDGISQGVLSQRLMVTTSNMTRVLAKLQRDGFIESAGAENDRRVKLIRITSKASDLLDEIWPAYIEKLANLTQGIPLDQQGELNEALIQWTKSLLEK